MSRIAAMLCRRAHQVPNPAARGFAPGSDFDIVLCIEINGSRHLGAEGVEYIFGLVGTTPNTMVMALNGRSDMRFLDTRHEEGAALKLDGASVIEIPVAAYFPTAAKLPGGAGGH